LKWYTFRPRTGLVLALLALPAWGVWYLIQPLLPPSLGKGPAGPEVPLEAFRRVWQEGPVVLLGLGDSITRGFGAGPGRGYFDLLAKNDDDRYPEMRGRDLRAVFPRLQTRNGAVSSSVSADHLERHLPRVEPYAPEVKGVVVLTTGGNDIIHDYGRWPPRDGAMYGATLAEARPWIENFRSRLREILRGLQARFPGGSHIFLANIYDPTDGGGDIERSGHELPAWPEGLKVLEAMNGAIAATAREFTNVHLIDLHALFLGHGLHSRDWSSPHYCRSDPHYWYYLNLEDPNERGYDAIRRLFLLEMARVFAR
jgi:lysophospholipase L1-like esterase